MGDHSGLSRGPNIIMNFKINFPSCGQRGPLLQKNGQRDTALPALKMEQSGQGMEATSRSSLEPPERNAHPVSTLILAQCWTSTELKDNTFLF